MTDRNPNVFKQIVLDAVKQSGQRAVVHSGWAGLDRSGISDNVFLIDSIPHSWLFPQMRAIVHHCGAGTTGAALRSGIPAIGVPFFGDQHFWASIITSLGVSPPPVPRKDLSADRLAGAMRVAIEDSSLRRRAQSLGAVIRQEDGIRTAVEIISGFLGRVN
jgi:UDP:flavonoid glycosyltransferase YjiC (YdhE family)